MTRRDLIHSAAAGAAGALGLGTAAGAEEASVKGTLRNGELIVERGGKPFLTYRHGPTAGPADTGPLFTRSGYLHPVYAPNGALVTDDFPPDHLHQRGVFMAWTHTRIDDANGVREPDFWNLGKGLARIRSASVTPRESGGRFQGFDAVHIWEEKRGDDWKEALHETWEVRFPALGAGAGDDPHAYAVFDVTSRQTPRVRLELPQYRYGGFNVRGARAWVGKETPMRLTTAQGKDQATAEGTPGPWADMSGPVDGKVAGIATLEHPSNFAAPNPLRVPPDLPYYVFCPSKDRDRVLEAGKEYIFRYRLVVHNGPADAALLNRLWKEFAG